MIRHFLESFRDLYKKDLQGFARKAEAALMAYDWPGNVRELEGVIGAAAMMAQPPIIDLADFPPQLRNAGGAAINAGNDLDLNLEEIQAVHARRMVARFGGDKTLAASKLGVSRATLYRLLARRTP